MWGADREAEQGANRAGQRDEAGSAGTNWTGRDAGGLVIMLDLNFH